MMENTSHKKKLPSVSGRGGLAMSRLLLGCVSAVLILPMAAVLASFFLGDADILRHLLQTTGPAYLLSTLKLCALVAILAGGFGTLCAILVSLTQFPGRRVFSVMLALPFAFPAYILAYTYGDFLGPFGGLAAFLADVSNLEGAREIAPFLPDIRNIWGAAFILSLAVYPYVYLAVRADLSSRSSAYLEASRALGASPFSALRRVILPGARAAIFGGLSLALMETTADFGVSQYLGVGTLSVGIFRTWYGLGDLTAAAQLAGGLFLVAALLLLIEMAARRGQRSENLRAHRRSLSLRLSPLMQGGAMIVCALPIIFGFLLPLGVLLSKLPTLTQNLRIATFMQAGLNTALIAGAGAGLIMIMAIILSYCQRLSASRGLHAIIRIMTMGYAMPGAVIAVGILLGGKIIFSPAGITLTSGGIFILLYAYMIRFLTAGYNSAHAGLDAIHTGLDMAARNLGAGPSRVVSHIHWPLGRASLLAGLVVVFIDIARELPATLLLRPFNFETLATQVYRLASDEKLTQAAPAALLLVGMGLIPVIILSMTEGRHKKTGP